MRAYTHGNDSGEMFDNPAQMLREMMARPAVYQADRNYLADDYRPPSSRWSGYRNGAELREDFLRARVDTRILSDIRAQVCADKEQSRRTVQHYRSVQGFAPIVPLVLQNVPDCMRASRRTAVKSKIVNVVVDVGATCEYDVETMAGAGAVIMGAVAGLERVGYRVNLYAVGGFDSRGTNAVAGVKVKDAGQSMDLARVAWPLVTPAFFRGVLFRYYQTSPHIHHCSSYGTTLGRAKAEEIVGHMVDKPVYLRITDVIRDNANAEEIVKTYLQL